MKKFLPKSISNPKGFTLIELMVVVSIIAILSIIGMVLYTGIQKGSRDARRKGDIDAIATALETNYTSGSATPYPALADTLFASGKVPLDPQNTGLFVYTETGAAGGTAGAAYLACAKLEGTGGNSSDNNAAAATNGGFYCRKNQQ